MARKIRGCSSFLYFVSRSSADSEHCQRELNFAQKEKKQIVAVQLESFKLPDGLRLSLGNRQIIHKYELSEREYHTRLASALGRDSEPIHPVPQATIPSPEEEQPASAQRPSIAVLDKVINYTL